MTKNIRYHLLALVAACLCVKHVCAVGEDDLLPKNTTPVASSSDSPADAKSASDNVGSSSTPENITPTPTDAGTDSATPTTDPAAGSGSAPETTSPTPPTFFSRASEKTAKAFDSATFAWAFPQDGIIRQRLLRTFAIGSVFYIAAKQGVFTKIGQFICGNPELDADEEEDEDDTVDTEEVGATID